MGSSLEYDRSSILEVKADENQGHSDRKNYDRAEEFNITQFLEVKPKVNTGYNKQSIYDRVEEFNKTQSWKSSLI